MRSASLAGKEKAEERPEMHAQDDQPRVGRRGDGERQGRRGGERRTEKLAAIGMLGSLGGAPLPAALPRPPPPLCRWS